MQPQCGLIVDDQMPCSITEHSASLQIAWDGIVCYPSEWQKLEALPDLLLPFTEHTKTLQRHHVIIPGGFSPF